MSDDQADIDSRLSRLVQSARIHDTNTKDVEAVSLCFEPHQLCSICSRITATSEALDLISRNVQPDDPIVEIWSHHKNETELKKSVSRGCHLCHLLYMQTGIPLSKYRHDFHQGLPDGQLHLYISTIGNVKVPHPRGYPRFHFEFGLGKPDQKDGRVRPHEPLLLMREVPDPDVPHGSFLTASTGSDAAFVTLNSWMSQCLKTHHCCSNQGEFPIYLPRRLLEVTGDASNPSIKLIETGGREKSEAPYLTLSHCWGTHVPLRLQQDNYVIFLEKINFDELPKLFQNAVQITLRLGFNYLWVDAMCIIQDHDIDWDEALRMSEVFGNSVCTISALAATDSTESCIYDRSPLSFVPCQVKTASGEVLDLFSWRARELLKFEGPNSTKSPLHQRAWVMQERYLTARQIHFSQNQLWWQCCEVTLSEINQNPAKSLPFLRAELRRSTRPSRIIERPIFVVDAFWKGIFTQRGKDNTMDWHSAYWNLMAFWFTPGKISREEDRWPAVSGIAKMIETVTGVRMLAGLWMSHLMFDMLWRSRPAKTNRRIRNGQPSWSWLSVNGSIYQDPVRWSDAIPRDKRFTAEVLELPEVAYEPTSSTVPYFYLSSKPLSLLIRAPMIKFPEIPEGVDINGDYDFGWQDIGVAEPLSRVVSRFLLRGFTCWTPDYVISSEDLSHAWILQWTRQEDYSRNHQHHRVDHQLNISGLIVKPLDSEQTRWCRIGRFRIAYRGRKGKPIGEFKTIRLY